MKNLFSAFSVQLLVLAALLFTGTATAGDKTIATKKSGDTTYIGLVLDRKGLTPANEGNVLLLCGGYVNGNYFPLPGGDLDSALVDGTRSAEIFYRTKNFTVYNGGKKIGNAAVWNSTIFPIDCSWLPAADISLQFTPGVKSSELPLFSGLLALSGNATTDHSTTETRTPLNLTGKELSAVKQYIKKQFAGGKKKMPPFNASSLSGFTFTSGGKGNPVYYFRYKVMDKNSVYNCVAVVTINNGVVSPLFSSFESDDKEYEDIGYTLWDMLDIDGDGTAELIMQQIYHEATGIEIFRKNKNGKYEQKFSAVLWGC